MCSALCKTFDSVKCASHKPGHPPSTSSHKTFHVVPGSEAVITSKYITLHHDLI